MIRLRHVSFLAAGAAGFVTDASVLLLLMRGGVDPYVARAVSFVLAICVTWLVNRKATFGPSGRRLRDEGARYMSVAFAVGSINYGLYAGFLLALPSLRPIAALVAASAIATMLSWLGYSRLVFHTATVSRLGDSDPAE